MTCSARTWIECREPLNKRERGKYPVCSKCGECIDPRQRRAELAIERATMAWLDASPDGVEPETHEEATS